MTRRLQLGDRLIGPGGDTLVVAELSGNHLGSFDRAASMVHAAKQAGADAIKLQTYTADTLTLDCRLERFRIRGGTLWDDRTLHDLYREAATPWEWQPELMKLAKEEGLLCFSSPFDETAVEFLEQLNIPGYKIASMELVDDALLATVAQTGKPVFLATGMADAEEIEHALNVLEKNGAGETILLHCISSYPADTREMNLKTIPDMAARFDRLVGLSDHSMTHVTALGAVALGACVVEKHFTLDRAAGGPDAAFSLEPDELRGLVSYVREMEAALGDVWYGATAGEEGMRHFRRSLCVVTDVNRGEVLTTDAVKSLRPGDGLSPRYLKDVIGRRTTKDIKRGEALRWDMVE